MKTIMEKYEIIHLKVKGLSDRKISRDYGVSRRTVRKYWNDYQASLLKLSEEERKGKINQVIEEIVEKPKYDSSNRKPRKYNEEIDNFLNQILKDEENKKERLGPNKQKLTDTQIYELVKAEGFDVGETTIRSKLREKRNKHTECYIRQEYEYGERFEYDFGEVKLIINNELTRCFIAVITAPASGFRWAYLYHNSKMDVFLDSQVRFFEMLGGSFKEGVYDNMRNVVSKFVGQNEKELNEELIKLATYYGFQINVTNCFSGNEKGNVEEAVKYIRNKVFSTKYEFESFKEAEDYLQNELVSLNSNSNIEEEKRHLTIYRPKYEVAQIVISNVNKYAFIQIDKNLYSVPDYLVDKDVMVKKYPNNIKVYFKNELVASHQRIKGEKKTCIDIMHYLDTFTRKPGALRNSAALNSVPRLKDIFNKYYKDNPKTFITILRENKDLEIDELEKVLCQNNTKSNINNNVEEETIKQLGAIAKLFVGLKEEENGIYH